MAVSFGFGVSATDNIHIAIVSRTLFYVPLWIADRHGFFKDEGIGVSIEVYNDVEKINEELRAGRVHIAIAPPESVIIDSYDGGSLRLIAGNAKKLPHFIITKPEIQTLRQLRGANFGVLSLQEGSSYLVHEVAKAAGLSPGDYQVTAVGGAPTRWRLLREGKIDAGLQPFPLSYQAEEEGFTNLGAVASYITDWQFTSVNADDRWASRNRRTVIGFLRALRRGQDYMKAHPGEAAQIASGELRVRVQLAQRALADSENLGLFDPQLDLSEPGLARVFDALQKVGLVSADEQFEMDRFVSLDYLSQSRDSEVRP